MYTCLLFFVLEEHSMSRLIDEMLSLVKVSLREVMGWAIIAFICD
jgi:hypothetical protein